MVQIVVTAEQAKQIGEALEPIEIVDQNGHRIGYYIQPFTDADIAEAKRRSQSQVGGRTMHEIVSRISKIGSQ